MFLSVILWLQYHWYYSEINVFFFQAEDGIRDHCVTGVQTCALPICLRRRASRLRAGCGRGWRIFMGGVRSREWHRSEEHTSELQSHSDLVCRLLLEIRRAHV